MTKPYYKVGEEVCLQSYTGEYTITDRAFSDTLGQYYLLEELDFPVYEDEIRKKYTPSTKSFDELMYDL
jgi:hypothetical protein